jgi:hypothetical protein
MMQCFLSIFNGLVIYMYDNRMTHETRKQPIRGDKKLKENLPLNHVVAQLDFSENYTCTSMEEVQSAYWNQSMVTIHPVVIHVYYKSIEDGKETLHHKSFTIISDELVLIMFAHSEFTA